MSKTYCSLQIKHQKNGQTGSSSKKSLAVRAKKLSDVFTFLPPPSQGINPIEDLWDLLEQEICNMNAELTNLQ